jgi:hypothetical protein
VNTYQQHISTNISSTSHHHKEHKEHKMYVQFYFYYGLQSLGFINNNWIEYNSTRAPALYARLTYILSTNWDEATILHRYQSVTGTRPVSSAARVCTRPGSLQPAYVRGQSTMQHAYTSEQLGFFFASHTQILCNLQSHSLLSLTVQSDPQLVTTHPSSPIVYSCSTTNQYEC